MFARLVLAVVVAALTFAGCDESPPPATRSAGDSHCRDTCFRFDGLTCAAVETECGRMHGLLTINGIPYDCKDAEPIACRLYRGMERCLARCEESAFSAPSLDERPSVSY